MKARNTIRFNRETGQIDADIYIQTTCEVKCHCGNPMTIVLSLPEGLSVRASINITDVACGACWHCQQAASRQRRYRRPMITYPSSNIVGIHLRSSEDIFPRIPVLASSRKRADRYSAKARIRSCCASASADSVLSSSRISAAFRS